MAVNPVELELVYDSLMWKVITVADEKVKKIRDAEDERGLKRPSTYSWACAGGERQDDEV